MVYWKRSALGVILFSVLLLAAGEVRAQTRLESSLYLYPETDFYVRVNLDIRGALLRSAPAYKKGWYVYSSKKSTINYEYDDLSYEADFEKMPQLSAGSWVVAREELQVWFDGHLLAFGLSVFEAQRFKELWLPRLNRSPYYEIGFVSRGFLDENDTLTVVPRPETLIRLVFYFIPLAEEKAFAPPVVSAPQRRGFTVVEAGGILAPAGGAVP